jgi:ribosomal protein S18 acetylase RimI-like enzyme
VSAAQRAFAARVAVDAAAATAATEVEGGVLLSTPELSNIWDLNQVMLAPGADAALIERTLATMAPETRKLTLFDPADPVGPVRGFRLEHCLLMIAGDEAAAWPEGVERVPPADLRDTRVTAYLNESDSADALAEMFDRFAAATPTATLVATRADDEEWAAWAAIANGAIDDVWVQPPFRGRGLGRAVTQAALAAGGWFLYTDAADPVPQGLYRSLGMLEVGTVVLLTRDRG